MQLYNTMSIIIINVSPSVLNIYGLVKRAHHSRLLRVINEHHVQLVVALVFSDTLLYFIL